ncbi:MAG: DUF4350 domain-containing protein [Anaerolineae bacterium]
MGRKRLNERWLVIILLLLLGGIVIVEQVVSTNRADPPLSTFSDERDGASALKSWLTDLGFEIVDEPLAAFEIPADVSVTFLLEPSETITPDEWNLLLDWVDSGGILVLSGSNLPARNLYFRLGYSFGDIQNLELAEFKPGDLQVQREAPFMVATDFSGVWQTSSDPNITLFRTETDLEHVVHLSLGDRPLVTSIEREKGHIIVAPENDIFNNEGLFGEANRSIALNLAALQGDNGRIWFDEWHHGQRDLEFFTGEVSSPGDWLRYTASGRATLLVALLLFVFVALNGRYFGRPQPLPESLERRGAAEYVDALAELTRQTGDTQVISTHSYSRLRRAIIKRYRLDPNLSDAEISTTLEKIKPEAAAPASQLLRALSKKTIGEKELIRLHIQIDQFTEEYL